MNENRKSKCMLISSMVLFGTIGIFRRYIDISSSTLAMIRGLIGMLFLISFIVLRKEKFSFNSIKKNIWLLIGSGISLGINWLLLFESYQYTSVAISTICYYMAPIFVIIVSPFLFGEKLSVKKVVCIIVACIGMVLVSGLSDIGNLEASEYKGIVFGIGAAVFYACVMLLNKKIQGVSAYEKTIVQLAVSTLVLFPYVLMMENGYESIDLFSGCMVLAVGIVHTGIAYTLYFGSMHNLSAQSIALYSYLDPIVAIVLSVVFLHEELLFIEFVGASLVLSATVVNELS